MTTSEMLRMRKDGATYQQIADVCGLSRQRVHQLIKKMDEQTPVRWICQDITFCSNRKCERKTCQRHHSNADFSVKPYHSFCDFTDTQYCPSRKDGADNDR